LKAEDVTSLYDDEYAASYEGKFLSSPLTAADAAYELRLLGTLLDVGSPRWLDVACGTGYFLRHFPEIDRKGLDLSPAMLRKAREGNPNIELIAHDFRDPLCDLAGDFDLVSCMWYAYCLVDTMEQLSWVIENLARWTSSSGTCFVPLADPAMIAGAPIP
jgi:SAM-dependent methyltransferase